MKVIFSRKGFDNSAGGCASPIIDGRLVPLPIPDRHGPASFADVCVNGEPLAPIVSDLTNRRWSGKTRVHMDPDIRRDSLPRKRGWCPLFGQAGAARSHLVGQKVGVGDLFLFFGWFREAEKFNGRYRFVRSAPNQHVIFGWLKVGEVWESPFHQVPSWAASHPHLVHNYSGGNTVFRAARQCEVSGGVFSEVSSNLILTCQGQSRSCWLLPSWMYPKGKPTALSYHTDLSRWKLSRRGALLRTVGRGQEFVLNSAHYQEATTWVKQLLPRH